MHAAIILLELRVRWGSLARFTAWSGEVIIYPAPSNHAWPTVREREANGRRGELGCRSAEQTIRGRGIEAGWCLRAWRSAAQVLSCWAFKLGCEEEAFGAARERSAGRGSRVCAWLAVQVDCEELQGREGEEAGDLPPCPLLCMVPATPCQKLQVWSFCSHACVRQAKRALKTFILESTGTTVEPLYEINYEWES